MQTLPRTLRSKVNRLAHLLAVQTEERERERLMREAQALLEGGATLEHVAAFLARQTAGEVLSGESVIERKLR